MIGRKQNVGVAKVMFDYWILVILWQTFRPVANRSLVDSLVKIGLFGMVLVYATRHKNSYHTSNILGLLFIFSISQMFTILLDSMTVGTFITVVFMLVQIIVFLIWLRHEEISQKSLEWFGGRIILVAVIMGGYSMFFRTARFVRALTSAGAYGSEAKSFLYSNHEYALYLATAIIFAIWMQYKKRISTPKLLFIIGFLGINIITTFSRTAIFACIIAAFMLSFFAGGKFFTRFSLAAAVAALIGVSNGTVRNFVLNKILKGSLEKSGSIVDQGRSMMYEEELYYFRRGTILQKLFGHGYAGNSTGGHDAYLFILNTGGIIMFIFFLIVLFRCLKLTLRIMKRDKMTGALCLGLQALVLLYMGAQTPIIFFSSMDSFFATVLFVMLPLYVSNHLMYNDYQESREL